MGWGFLYPPGINCVNKIHLNLPNLHPLSHFVLSVILLLSVKYSLKVMKIKNVYHKIINEYDQA